MLTSSPSGLIKRLQALGDTPALRADARRWIQANPLEALLPHELMPIVGAYDLVHRLAYSGTPAPLTSHLINALEAFIRGDRRIDELQLFDALSRAIRRPNPDPRLLDRPLQWLSITIERWSQNPTPTQAALLAPFPLAPMPVNNSLTIFIYHILCKL